MRSPADMDIIQIEITNACPKKCGACTRMAPHVQRPFMMDLDQFDSAVHSMHGWKGMLGVMGGEPTVHPRFEAISRLFSKIWGPPRTAKNGRGAIADFSKYANTRLHDRTTGRGLWTSLGPKYYEHYEIIQEVYDHQCINTHENPGLHQGNLITRKEMGIPDDEWIKLRDNCWVQNTWSASVTPYGAYFCEVAGALDVLYNGGKNAWPLEADWWKRTPAQFGKQLDLCELCAMCVPNGPTVIQNKDKDVISPLHLEKLKGVKSPAVAKGAYHPWTPEFESETIDARVDRYMPSPEMRVSPDHDSVRPRRITGIVTCVDRDYFLEKTLATNGKLADDWVVVTRSGDSGAKELVRRASKAGAVVRWIESDAWQSYGDAFNKGRMINEAIRQLPDDTDWILLTDADVLLDPKTVAYLKGRALNPGCLYGTYRERLENGKPVPRTAVDGEPNGYFQLFNRRARAIRDRWAKRSEGFLSTEFCSAGGIDSWFMQQWPEDKRVMLADIPVRHIEHGAFGAGWNGPTPGNYPGGTKAKRWHQVGMINHEGDWLELLPVPGVADLKLVDTLNGDVAILPDFAKGTPIPPEILKPNAQGLVFKGREIGRHHVHVSSLIGDRPHAASSDSSA